MSPNSGAVGRLFYVSWYAEPVTFGDVLARVSTGEKTQEFPLAKNPRVPTGEKNT